MKLDDVQKLHQKKYRNQFGFFLVEGEHLILELDKAAKTNSLLASSVVYASENFHGVDVNFKTELVSTKRMQAMSDTKSPQGIVAVVPLNAVLNTDADKAPSQTVYLHEIQDPGNLGTILRTLAWFGNFKCVLSPNSVDPFNPKVVRASMGAIFHVPIEIDVELTELKNQYDQFACLDIQGEPLSSESFHKHQCFVFGNEARGVPHEQLQALNTQSFSIAGSGALESLNLATAVNMCAYELNRL